MAACSSEVMVCSARALSAWPCIFLLSSPSVLYAIMALDFSVEDDEQTYDPDGGKDKIEEHHIELILVYTAKEVRDQPDEGITGSNVRVDNNQDQEIEGGPPEAFPVKIKGQAQQTREPGQVDVMKLEESGQTGDEKDMDPKMGTGEFEMLFKISPDAGQARQHQDQAQPQTGVDQAAAVKVIVPQDTQGSYDDPHPGG